MPKQTGSSGSPQTERRLVVWGDADRERLGRRVSTHRDAVAARGLALLRTFLKDSFRPDAFEVVTIEVYAARMSIGFR